MGLHLADYAFQLVGVAIIAAVFHVRPYPQQALGFEVYSNLDQSCSLRIRS